jgi:uncharacterized RDD family membrane protein YckC
VTEVVTGEAVALDVPVAAFPSRMAALLLDMLIQLALLAILVITTVTTPLNEAALAAIWATGSILIIVGYPTIFETLSRGKTLGKMAVGLRVVSDDGGPVRFRQALVRALAGIFEIWSIVLDPVALIASMLSVKGKRLGDMFAGTYVIQERVPPRGDLPPEFAVVPPPLAGWAQALELSRLSDQDAEAASSYLRRFRDLRPAARDELGLRLAAAVAGQVSPPPPPGTPPAAFLAAVLAVRRQRESVRLTAQRVVPPDRPAEQHPADRLPADRLPADRLPADRLPADRLPAEQPSAERPSAESPSPEPLSAEQPGTGGFATPR